MVKVLSDMPQAQVFILFKLLLYNIYTSNQCNLFQPCVRVKTYHRSTMGQERLNDLLLHHVHKAKTDSLDLVAVAKEHVACKTMFGP